MRAYNKYSGLQGLAGLTLFVPVMFMFYSYQTNIFPFQGATPFYTFDDEFFNKHIMPVLKEDRPYKIFHCTGNTVNDEKALHNFFLSSQKMMQHNDTVCGVKIIMDKGANYDSYVKAINILNQNRVDIFFSEDNVIWTVKWSDGEIKNMRKAQEDTELSPM